MNFKESIFMVLKFNLDIMVMSEKWSDEAQKETFIEKFNWFK
jgi:hypothetical protein